MKNKIVIENNSVKAKIREFVNTCDSVKGASDEKRGTRQIGNTFKLMLNFLKKDGALEVLYARFASFEGIEPCYALAKKIVENGFAVVLDGADGEKSGETQAFALGSVVEFGKKTVRDAEQKLAWKVIKRVGGKAMLFAEKAYLWEPFDAAGGVDWAVSSLRDKLNSEWIQEVFSDKERAMIDVTAGSDPIFIFSSEQLEELIPDAASRTEGMASWWTATPASGGGIISVKRNGEINEEGTLTNRKQGVRPVLWVVCPDADSGAGDKTDSRSEGVRAEEATAEAPLEAENIVVVENEGFYYVVSIGPRTRVTSARLKNLIGTAPRFSSREEVEEMLGGLRLNKKKYRLEVSYVVMEELVAEENEEAARNDIICDQDGIPILRITSRKAKVIHDSEEDELYKYIDRERYEAAINERLAVEKALVDAEFDYFHIGKADGYRVALDCALHRIRYEIFKARSILDSYDDYPNKRELYYDDERFYRGYAEALRDAMEIQRGCVLQPCEWVIHAVDLRKAQALKKLATDLPEVMEEESADDETAAEVEKKQTEIDPLLAAFINAEDMRDRLDGLAGNVPSLGSYTVRFCTEFSELNISEDKKNFVLMFSLEKGGWLYRGEEAEFRIPDNIPVVLPDDRLELNETSLDIIISNQLRSYCKLKKGDQDYTVSEANVPALADVAEYLMDAVGNNGDPDDPGCDMVQVDLRYISDVNSICRYRFKDNTVMKSVRIPNELRELPEGLFMNCSVLSDVGLPMGLLTIGKSVFENCVSISKMYITDSLVKIGDRAFFGCERLKKIYLPKSLEYIGSEAFGGCKKLDRIYLPSSLKYIADDAFDGCKKLKYVEAPRGISLPTSLTDRAIVNYYVDRDFVPEEYGELPVPTAATECREDRETDIVHGAPTDGASVLDDVLFEVPGYYEANIESADSFTVEELLASAELLISYSFADEIPELSSVLKLLRGDYSL